MNDKKLSDFYEEFFNKLDSELNQEKGDEVCRECGSDERIIDYKHGEVICRKCGLVLVDKLFDFGPEWRAFDEEQMRERSRAGPPLKLFKQNISLTTEIDKRNSDINKKPIPTEKIFKFYRMRREQKRISNSSRNLSIAFPELDRICHYLNMENIKEDSAKLYRKIAGIGLTRGRSIEGMVAATLYLKSREHHEPITLKELEEASGVKKKEIGRNYRHLCRSLNIKTHFTKPEDYIPRFASMLGVSGRVDKEATKILEKAREENIPIGEDYVAAAVALCAASDLTPENIAKKLPVAKQTIYKYYKKVGNLPDF